MNYLTVNVFWTTLELVANKLKDFSTKHNVRNLLLNDSDASQKANLVASNKKKRNYI